MSTVDTQQETLFTVETKYHAWYIDYDRVADKYDVYKDEKFRVRRNSLGEALEYIFNTLGSCDLKVIKK